ncbi:hypothetical protein BFJ67_g17966 [Fusarium oxysporum f. sp. cepae]|nr:hypothetical protein BFJ67_g17966 [Fusarium oxysporum f. sp. cepae]
MIKWQKKTADKCKSQCADKKKPGYCEKYADGVVMKS